MRALVTYSLFASILLLGTSGIVQQSYAGFPDPNPPSYRGEDCSVTYLYTNFGVSKTDDPQVPGSLEFGGTCVAGDPGTLNSDFNHAYCQTTTTNGEVESSTIEGRACHIHVPNFFDQFNTKLIRVQVFWDGDARPTIDDTIKPDPKEAATCTFVDRVIPDDISPGHFYEDWICHPNPDNERIWLNLDTRTVITQAVVDAISFDRNAVGGDMIPMQTTSILVAGTQTMAAWMIPVLVSAIGIGIVIARKF